MANGHLSPSAVVRLFEGSRFDLIATEEDFISLYPLFARYKTDPFNLIALLRLACSCGHF